MSKKILVTGGAGFLGTNLSLHLVRHGHEVIVLDDFSTGQRRLILRHGHRSFMPELIRHDVCTPFRIECDEIYHLACPAAPEHYQADPIRTTMTAVQGTFNALSCAADVGARILIASTSEVYGEPLEHPQVESLWSHINPVGERGCYDTGKAAAESLAHNFCEERDLDVRIARIHNTYGPYMTVNDGRMVPNFIQQALAGEDITVYGDGQQTRSLCYVDDMVAGLVALLENESLANGMPVNLGNPDERTVLSIAELVVKICGGKSAIVHEDLPEDDPTRRCPDIGFATRVTGGWKPTWSLARGLAKTVEYFQSVQS